MKKKAYTIFVTVFLLLIAVRTLRAQDQTKKLQKKINKFLSEEKEKEQSEEPESETIQQLDMDEIFERLALGEHLSPNRHVGVYAIVELMKQQAMKLARGEQRVANG